MFHKLAILFISAVAIVSADDPAPSASATPADNPAPSNNTTIHKTINHCNVGKLSCCDSIEKPLDAVQEAQLRGLNVALGTLHSLLGVHCNPITAVIGVNTASHCNAQPACCSKKEMNGVAVLGCDPISVNV